MAGSQFHSDGLVNIDRLLNGQDFYEIPLLQRNYVWAKENINILIDDIKESMDEDITQDYFIGSMVFSTENGKKVVVDGQQRMTTLSLIFAVAVKFLKDTKKDQYANLYIPYLYKDTVSDIDGSILSMKRLKHHIKDDEYFSNLIQEKNLQNATSTSQNNMLSAKETIETKLEPMHIDDLIKFVNYLAKRVHIISMVTSNLNIAFRIFETLNDRGAKLQPEDLLKNMLLRNLSDSQYPEVAKKWDDLISVLTNENGKPIAPTSSFLKHYVMSKGFLVQKAKLYEWFEEQTLIGKNKEELLGFNLKTDEGIRFFINELIEEATLYSKVLSGNFEKSIDNCIKLGVKQTLVIVLATKDFEYEKKRKIYDLMESLVFSYVITSSRFNEFEKSLFKISKKLRNSKKDENLFEEALKDIKNMILDKKEQALNALVEYKMKKSDKKKAKYILEKLGKALDDSDLSGYTIEHIMPEEKSLGWNYIKESKEEYTALVSKLGNLTLISNSNNSSLKNKDFEAKKLVYKNQPILTKSIIEEVVTGTSNTKLDKALRKYDYKPVKKEWSKEEIERRSKALRRLGEYVWFEQKL